MDSLYGVRVVGPLAPYARGFAQELARLGFTKGSARGQLGLAAHVSRWLAGAGLDAAGLDAATVDAFLAARQDAGYARYLTPKALGPLLGYLRGLGATPQPQTAPPASVAADLLERYRGYLLAERGLQVATARGYADLVRPFIAECVGGGRLQRLTAGEVSAFLVAESARLAPTTLQRLASALRSLLRLWHAEGLVGVSLVEAVPKVANRCVAPPRALEPAQVQAMLSSCDRETAAGLRDWAILTLLARLGLRAGEVAGLRLDDIGWRVAEITARGKGGRRDRLPLPVDVGQAVAEYLRWGRPATALDRGVFIRLSAPRRSLTSGGVTQVVASAARRAGLGVIYAHRLRHSAATSMLAEGASLTEIGQLLRHRRPRTTSVYAKVDVEALRRVARPWPSAS
jgi:integrase/recombinase XerD